MENSLSSQTGENTEKSQKRAERQRRRAERRQIRHDAAAPKPKPDPEAKRRKSLPGYLAKYRREISAWLRHYMTLICKADDAGVSYVRNMTRDERNDLIQEYVDVSEFRSRLDDYLKEEDLKNQLSSS